MIFTLIIFFSQRNFLYNFNRNIYIPATLYNNTGVILMNSKLQFLKGTLEVCILKIINDEEVYGYEIISMVIVLILAISIV